MGTLYKVKYPLGKVSYGIDFYFNGKRVRKIIGNNRAIAKRVLAKTEQDIILNKFNLAQFSKPQGIPLSDVMNNYINHKGHALHPGYYKRWSIQKQHILRILCDIPVNELSITKLSYYQKRRLDEKRTASTINRELVWLKACLQYAKKSGLINSVPFDEVPKLKQKKKPPVFLSKDEINRVKQECKNEYLLDTILFLINTGLRRSEFWNLQWEEVDLEREEMIVQSGKLGHDSGLDYRMIPLNKATLEILRKHKELLRYRQQPFRKDQNNRRAFTRLAKRLRIKHISFNILRHTFASHLLLSGATLYDVSKLLGHSNITTTQIYAHLTQAHLQKQVNNLNL